MKTINFQIPHNQYFTKERLIGKSITREGRKIGEVVDAEKMEQLPFWNLTGEIIESLEAQGSTTVSISVKGEPTQ